MNMQRAANEAGVCPTGKRWHATAESAEIQKRSLEFRRAEAPGGQWDRPGLSLHVYKCNRCPGYHVGNDRRGRRAE